MELLESKQDGRKIDILKAAERLKVEDSVARVGGGVIPTRVADRMTGRMIPFVGLPLLGAVGSFGYFYYSALKLDQQYSTMLVASVTVFWLVVGLLGITYSLFSADWDDTDDPKGGLGRDNFKTNLGWVKEGVGKGRRDNLIARENIEEVGGMENVEKMRKELEERDEKRRKRLRGLDQKLRE